MFLRPVLACGAICLCAALANAQQQGGQDQGQPATQRSVKPPGGAPGASPEADPVASTNILIRGRVIATATREFPLVEVHVETGGGQPVGVAYTNSTGEFSFQNSGFLADQDFYIIIDMEGYKPFRDRVNGGFNFATGFSGSATAFLEMQDVKAPAKNGEVIVDLKRLNAKVPGKAVDEYERALKDSSKGDTDSAIGRLQRVIRLAPDFYEAQSMLGAQYMKMGKFQAAESTLMRANDLSPASSEPVINLGRLYYQRAQERADAGESAEAAVAFKKALAFLQESVRRNPLSAPANSYLGAALFKTGAYDEAELTLNRALELDDHESDARLMLINVYIKQTRYDRALALIKTFLAENPKAPQRASLQGMQAQLVRMSEIKPMP